MQQHITDIEDELQIYTVSQVIREINDQLTQSFTSIWVKGEISNIVRAASGHLYFSLKDENAQIRCAMFRSQNQQLSFEPKDGLEALAQGRVDVYAQRGSLQLIIEQMEPAGLGALQLQFEQLKRKLMEEGLFDESHKKPIPTLARTVGLITSPKGAALHDTLTTLKQRFALIDVIIYPATVQGKTAATDVCQMLEIANRRKEVDVLLLIRGGGSIEDLQVFNDERVARAIAASKLPIITGIGHEVDFTIADFVSDCRMPTPTAAAVRVSPDSQALLDSLSTLQDDFEDLLFTKIDGISDWLYAIETRLKQLHPSNIINERWQQIDQLQKQIGLSIQNILHIKRQSFEHSKTLLEYSSPRHKIEKILYMLNTVSHHIGAAMGTTMNNHKQNLRELEVKIKSFNPRDTLKRGYAIVTDDKDHIVRSARNVKLQETVHIKLASGQLKAAVKKIIP